MESVLLFKWLQVYQNFALANFDHAQLFLSGAAAINSSMRVFELNRGKERMYWLHSLALVILMGFGGGFVGPMLIGKPSSPVANDAVIPLCILSWYFVHYLGGYNFLNRTGVKVVWTVFLGLFRTHGPCNIIKVANAVLAPGPYYPHPFVGPVLVGTALGCIGQFFPLNKGLEPIAKSTGWPIQGAFLTSLIYQVMVYDKNGIVGTIVRAIVGNHSDDTVRAALATMQIVTLVSQVVVSPEINLLAPIHQALYSVFQVQGPLVGPRGKHRMLDTFFGAFRISSVFVAVVMHLILTQPSTILFAGQTLSAGQAIGICQLAGSLRNCRPMAMTIEGEDLAGIRVTTFAEGMSAARTVDAAPASVNSGTVNFSSIFHPLLKLQQLHQHYQVLYEEFQHQHVSLQPQPNQCSDPSNCSATPKWSMIIPSKERLSRLSSPKLSLDSDGSVRITALPNNDSKVTQPVEVWRSARKCGVVEESFKAKWFPYLTLDRISGQPTVHCGDGSKFSVAPLMPVDGM